MTDQKQVLLIDDEPDLLEILCMLVEEEGIRVLSAKNGEEGLDMFAEHKPGLVVTDVQLPGANGADVAASIKEAAPDTRVVMMSGVRCPPGADAHIAKPIDFDEFTAIIRKMA